MKTPFDKKYNAKVLLFGEYTIINGGSALAVPLSRYFGQWCKSENEGLHSFFNYLKQLDNINADQVKSAIEEQWKFCSNIPIGYGCGSSGSLSAAAYDCFFSNQKEPLLQQKKELAIIENFFHGQSSGLDPLVSLINQPILVEGSDIKNIQFSSLKMDLFLVDSLKKRKTSDMVKIFNQKRRDEQTFQVKIDHLDVLNRQAISAILCGDKSNLFECFREISHLQWKYFREMIPDVIKPIWRHGLDSNDYYLKLSGAGGGGFFLGMGGFEGDKISLDF